MRRRTFDALATVAGLVIAIALVLAGVLLTWGNSFISSQVHNQLAAQKIYFPPASSQAIKTLPPADAAAMAKYAGLQMTTGAQAEAYADHFIAVHLREIGQGQTYAQLSAKALANPKDTALAGQVQTVFRGETLRGLLLNAYGFWKMGEIMWIGALTAFAAAGLLLILSILGFAHLRRAAPAEEVFPKLTGQAEAHAG
jgi:hypothetical protein